MQSPQLLTAPEAAAYLRVKTTTIRAWTMRRKIPFIRLPRSRAVRFRRQDLDRVIQAGLVPPVPRRRQTVEEAQSRFPMVPCDLAELVQDPALLGARGLGVAGMDRFQVFPFALAAHDAILLRPVVADQEGNILNGATIPPSVTL